MGGGGLYPRGDNNRNRIIGIPLYRKLPLISPGLIQVRKGFWMGL